MTSQINAIPGFSEPVAVWTHLVGVGVFLLLAWPLLRQARRNPRRMLALAIFVLSCLFVLSMSSVYHMLEPESGARAVLRRLDHAAIFALIAGTFTPIHAIVFRGPWRWGMLLFIWSAAAAGIALKTVFFDAVPPWLGVSLYVALGWVGVASVFKLLSCFGLRFVAPLIQGGVAYTIGAGLLGVLSLLGEPMLVPGVIGRHELFHLAVLAGIGFHWQFVHRIAGGAFRCAESRRSPRRIERRERRRKAALPQAQSR